MTIIKKTYKCDICGKEYNSSRDIEGRVIIDHPYYDELYDANDIEYKEVCAECTHKIAGVVQEIICNKTTEKFNE